jgi:hypothetical protein
VTPNQRGLLTRLRTRLSKLPPDSVAAAKVRANITQAENGVERTRTGSVARPARVSESGALSPFSLRALRRRIVTHIVIAYDVVPLTELFWFLGASSAPSAHWSRDDVLTAVEDAVRAGDLYTDVKPNSPLDKVGTIVVTHKHAPETRLRPPVRSFLRFHVRSCPRLRGGVEQQ